MTFITINFTSFEAAEDKNKLLVTSLRSFDPLVKLIYITQLLLSKISTFLLAFENLHGRDTGYRKIISVHLLNSDAY